MQCLCVKPLTLRLRISTYYFLHRSVPHSPLPSMRLFLTVVIYLYIFLSHFPLESPYLLNKVFNLHTVMLTLSNNVRFETQCHVPIFTLSYRIISLPKRNPLYIHLPFLSPNSLITTKLYCLYVIALSRVPCEQNYLVLCLFQLPFFTYQYTL